MKNEYFQAREKLSDRTLLKLSEVVNHLAFNEQGLIPVITQDVSTKQVLMFAWMNKHSLEQTLITKKMTYWSRSRKKLWVKGETSGNAQLLVSISFDCDGDTVLCQVEQTGPACHTGRPNCFYFDVDIENKEVMVCGDASI
ncbi:MAG: phosphoribosyl-AMP cyclohydrolase [Paraglaciecola sp.]|uniref:phosphoribosyl-AMP cyclohydrolase n=1 Tax=Paraglaciecola sp. TaxID=1920173 RepID=UPI00329770D7